MFYHKDMALGFLQQCLKDGQGGKTLLVALQANQPKVAWGAGLRGEGDYESFSVFAKFALQKISKADAYWLMLPLQKDDCKGYSLELKSSSESWFGNVWLAKEGMREEAREAKSLIMDLFSPIDHLPGVMRRDLENLADQLEIRLF